MSSGQRKKETKASRKDAVKKTSYGVKSSSALHWNIGRLANLIMPFGRVLLS